MHVETPPDVGLRQMLAGLARGVRPVPGYPHWDKLRHLEPPAGVEREAWWAAIKVQRSTSPLPLVATDGRPCRYGTPDDVLRLLHFVDQQCAGQVAMDEVVTDDAQARQHYLVSGLMEEAIRSSQLEGASTTRQVAKDLLRSGREPVDRSEQMILNNYRALTFMREQAGDRLAPQTVLELQRILTDGTLDEPDAAGRLQRPDEVRVAVYDGRDRILHAPPPAEELPARLQALCDFANEPIDGERFIHPVVRGVLLHFWLAYDHPFVDGNGRTARALFYWYLRTRGYWLVEYLSISRILREAPAQYTRAFLHTETDDGDTTYFLLHQLEAIERAVHELYAYLRRKMREVRAVESLIADDARFNHRQLALLSDALRHPERAYTFAGHAREHRVTHETARTDLSQLARRGLLVQARHGRGYRFTAPPELERRLRGPARVA
ncbi:MAG TPA: Fic family protein [Conexibacter sp.]|nr:Fic family protein [Conexibacter sp.]